MRTAILISAALALNVSGAPASAQSKPNASHPCKREISCDCESIDAGVLTGGWKTDCRACEKGIHQKCMEAYANGQPLYRAIGAGGFCRNACSVTGDNPTPEPPPAQPVAAPSDAPHRPAKLKLRCRFEEEWKSETVGGKVVSGCVRKDGKRNGLWLAEDEKTGELVEIYYEDGKEVSRKSIE